MSSGQKNSPKRRPPRTIVIDMDETLVHTASEPEDLSNCDFRPGGAWNKLSEDVFVVQFKESPRQTFNDVNIGVVRPYAREFLEFCRGYFDNVIIWSAGIKPYVNAVMETLIEDMPHRQPHAILSRESCLLAEDGNFLKPLQELPNLLPHLYIDPEHTIIIDDKIESGRTNDDRLVLIPAFYPASVCPSAVPAHADKSLLDVMEWLTEPKTITSKNVKNRITKLKFQK